MIGALTKARIKDRLHGRPHLIPVFTNVCHIPERLYEADPTSFFVWNTAEQRYEVHCLDNKGDSYSMTVPYRELDVRILERIRRSDLRVRGLDIYREMDEINERLDTSAQRARQNELLGQCEEMTPYFRKVAWEGI